MSFLSRDARFLLRTVIISLCNSIIMSMESKYFNLDATYNLFALLQHISLYFCFSFVLVLFSIITMIKPFILQFYRILIYSTIIHK